MNMMYEMERVMKTALLAALAALAFLYSGAAHADACAVVLKTPDGFLALREKPTVQSTMIAKLLQGDYLAAVENKKAGIWMYVTESRDGTEGWVSRKHVQEFECPAKEPDYSAIP